MHMVLKRKKKWGEGGSFPRTLFGDVQQRGQRAFVQKNPINQVLGSQCGELLTFKFSSIFIAAQWRHHTSIRYAEGTGTIGLSGTRAYSKNTKKLSEVLLNLVQQKRDTQRAASKPLTWNSWLCKLPEMKRSYSTALVLPEYPHKTEIYLVPPAWSCKLLFVQQRSLYFQSNAVCKGKNPDGPLYSCIPLLPQTQMVSGRAGKEAWSLGALPQPSPNSWQWLNTVAQNISCGQHEEEIHMSSTHTACASTYSFLLFSTMNLFISLRLKFSQILCTTQLQINELLLKNKLCGRSNFWFGTNKVHASTHKHVLPAAQKVMVQVTKAVLCNPDRHAAQLLSTKQPLPQLW